jgi:hypothetical protein
MTTWIKVQAPPKYPRQIILAGEIYYVSVEEVMISYQQVEIQDTGELEIDGEVAIIE